MTCTFTIDVLADTVNVAVARGVTAGGNPVEDGDDAEVVVLEFGLIIDKSNDAPLETLELPDGSTADLPTADEGETVTYTLEYDLFGDPVTDGVITDVLPAGVTYIGGSATSNAEFTFQGYDATTRTLTWTADDVSEDGNGCRIRPRSTRVRPTCSSRSSISPAIDSDQTEPDEADSPIFVPTVPLAITNPPTLPPTDTIATPAGARPTRASR